MEGVINLRGKIVSVIDLRKRFGIKETTPSRRNRILVVEFNGRLSGLIVDSASEVLKIPPTDIEPPPAVLQEGGLNCVTGLGKYKGRLIMLLDTSKLLEFGSLRVQKAPGEVKPAATSKAEVRGAAAR
jgi:purine-binding chemotaxis protein CheW